MKPKINEETKKELLQLVTELESLHDGALIRENLFDIMHKSANQQVELSSDELLTLSVLYKFSNSVCKLLNK